METFLFLEYRLKILEEKQNDNFFIKKKEKENGIHALNTRSTRRGV